MSNTIESHVCKCRRERGCKVRLDSICPFVGWLDGCGWYHQFIIEMRRLAPWPLTLLTDLWSFSFQCLDRDCTFTIYFFEAKSSYCFTIRQFRKVIL